MERFSKEEAAKDMNCDQKLLALENAENPYWFNTETGEVRDAKYYTEADVFPTNK